MQDSLKKPFVELVLIPAGEFLMGSPRGHVEQIIAQGLIKGWVERALPQHRLHLPDYCIAQTPVTNAQYLAFVQATSHTTPEHWKGGKPPAGKEDHPVVCVKWHDATAYCNWLAEVTGKAYRLPSEAEWEKAARGTDGRIYPWGDEWDATRCNSWEGGPGDTTPVGQYSPRGDSPYGCVDMVGNVWEWTLSLFKGYPYDPENGREELKAGDDIHRVLRGGSWLNNPGYARCAFRSWLDPADFNNFLGFRLCVAAQQE
jgi:formylglycine-generating enzyme required for sulfatase activity